MNVLKLINREDIFIKHGSHSQFCSIRRESKLFTLLQCVGRERECKRAANLIFLNNKIIKQCLLSIMDKVYKIRCM